MIFAAYSFSFFRNLLLDRQAVDPRDPLLTSRKKYVNHGKIPRLRGRGMSHGTKYAQSDLQKEARTPDSLIGQRRRANGSQLKMVASRANLSHFLISTQTLIYVASVAVLYSLQDSPRIARYPVHAHEKQNSCSGNTEETLSLPLYPFFSPSIPAFDFYSHWFFFAMSKRVIALHCHCIALSSHS